MCIDKYSSTVLLTMQVDVYRFIIDLKNNCRSYWISRQGNGYLFTPQIPKQMGLTILLYLVQLNARSFLEE